MRCEHAALCCGAALLYAAQAQFQGRCLPGRECGRAALPPHQPEPCSRDPWLQADLFGDVAEAKEAAEFASAYKEARKCRG